MVVISTDGLVLDGSAKAMAGLPTQAFGVMLSGSDIEEMIACVQNGGDIQLSLGSSPKFLFDDREVRIPKSSDLPDYDLYRTSSERPSSANKLPNSTMSIFKAPKPKAKAKVQKETAPAPKREKTLKTAPDRASEKPSIAPPRSSAGSDKELGSQGNLDDAIANLKSSYAKVEADRRENSAVVVGGLFSSKGGKVKPAKRLLEAQAAASPRSLTPSPALSGIRSPSLVPGSNSSDEKMKQQRSHIFHELAVRDMTYQELFGRWNEGTEQEFSAALSKVADFDDKSQKWVIKKMYWKELDVFEHNYAEEEDRQKAIDNAIRQYDRMRLGASDPLWQKLLPKSQRGKGVCLSRLQAALAKPKPTLEAASASGGDSEKDDSASSTAKKAKGGEAMSRSSSQASTGKKKLTASEAQAKRLLSNSKKSKAASTAKASTKIPSTKTTAKTTGAKGGRVLSKEFVSDSSSDDDEVPLSTSMPKAKAVTAPTPKPVERAAPKPKAIEKAKEAPAPKSKPITAAKTLPKEKVKEKEKEKDTIRAQVIAKPIKPPTKRPRESEDDDSSSSGTPLSKRVKSGVKALPAASGSVKPRTPSDASQNGRGTGPGVPLAKAKNASPVKSSPLASSPPTNASDLDHGKSSLVMARERERELDRDTIISSASSNADSTVSVSTSKKRPAPDPASGSKAKRQRPSQDTIDKASKFKQFYARYEQLHHELAANENPDPEQVTDLLDMHDRLRRMKDEIYASVEA
ncbi:hypothetical protein MMYC01_202898 [Madurella mycetomatis]|uniref:RNA polymerase II elongation factor ELL N-terminal domain-containing protein n=1 Tax=Madurella mycetomatis TaxID=100816 RepID=A0A175W9S8_9PEZI|nr:hypothetical protein MMYC01_202898 [Madurella mycetomatis]